MYFLLRWYLNAMVKHGDLSIIGADGNLHKFGDGTGNKVCVRLRERSLYLKLAIFSDLYAGEAYMDGTLVMESGSIYDLLALMGSQTGFSRNFKWTIIDRLRTIARRMVSMNPIGRVAKLAWIIQRLSPKLFQRLMEKQVAEK